MSGPDIKSLSIHFAPLLPEAALIALALAALAALALSTWSSKRLPLWRAIGALAFFLFFLNPSISEEKREPVTSVAAVIIDKSASQNFQQRGKETEEIRKALQSAYGTSKSLELRFIEAPSDGETASRTDLFSALAPAMADVPEQRRAGVIFVTDGQVHDTPAPEAIAENYGPVHVLLTGRRDEKDRSIRIVNAPAFGIAGQNVEVRFRVDESGPSPSPDARVTVRMAGRAPEVMFVETGAENTITLPVEHAGQNVFEITTETSPGELTAVNNRVALEFQGVRDRMRVLLVSGRPHAGGRTWRDLLTSDPGVDLVHFTILRDPEKIDGTPPSEMSLIAFPFKELFEVKLHEFDLIIFDRYSLNRVLPDFYFDNIARYVKEGGAFLEASGPDYAGKDSLYYTSLNDILPGAPNGQIYESAFTPRVTDTGRTHPVTRALSGTQPLNGDTPPAWGRWLRQVGMNPAEGADVVMDGYEGHPLLLLSRTGEGRAAQIASDQIWLWARGYEGGGPHAELLRRTVHWLMKEPELDERALDVSVDGRTITVRRAAYKDSDARISVTHPDGKREDFVMKDNNAGYLDHSFRAGTIGVYEIESGDGQSRYAIVGESDPPELREVLTTADRLAPVAAHTGGGVFWVAEDGMPSLRIVRGQTAYGSGWMGLRDTGSYSVTGLQEKPALPVIPAIALLCALSVLGWWIEGRRR